MRHRRLNDKVHMFFFINLLKHANADNDSDKKRSRG